MDEALLSSLGITEKEIRIYNHVLRSPKLSPSQLAKAAGIKRTTVYSLARGLVEKGFLVENTLKRPRTFTVATPNDLEHVLSEERKVLFSKEKLIKRLAQELKQFNPAEGHLLPVIRFIESGRMKQFINLSVKHWNESMIRYDRTYWGFQDQTFAKEFPDAIDLYWRRAPKDIVLKLLSNISLAEFKLKGKYPRRQIKVWNKATNFVSTIWVMGDYVVVVNTRRHPFYLLEIQDATIAHDLREVFKNLWPLV